MPFSVRRLCGNGVNAAHWKSGFEIVDSGALHALPDVMRDDLRHALVATAPTYPHGKDTKRARQVSEAFQRQPADHLIEAPRAIR